MQRTLKLAAKELQRELELAQVSREIVLDLRFSLVQQRRIVRTPVRRSSTNASTLRHPAPATCAPLASRWFVSGAATLAMK